MGITAVVIKYINTKLALMIVLVGFFSAPNVQAALAWHDGNRLFELSRGWVVMNDNIKNNGGDDAMMDAAMFAGYVAGVLEALELPLPNGTTLTQMCDVVADYLEAHPEDRNLVAWSLVKSAVVEKFSEQ